MTIVELIRKLQLERDGKVSLNRLEKELGLGKSTISSWAKKSPSLDKLILVANHFNVSIDYLAGRTDDVQSHLSADKKAMDDPGIELYAQLDTEDRAEVRGTMKQMLKADKYAAKQKLKHA